MDKPHVIDQHPKLHPMGDASSIVLKCIGVNAYGLHFTSQLDIHELKWNIRGR